MRLDYGYIVIPTGTPRDKYVSTALNRERVSVLRIEGKGILKDCYIDKHVLQNIRFPESENDLGSLVVIFQNTNNRKATVIATLSNENESQLLKENEFSIKKEYLDNNVRISGNAKDGTLFLNIDNVDGGADLNIDVTGSGSNGSIKINCNGTITTYAKGEVKIESNSDINLVTPEGNKVYVNGGKEPLLLGDTTQQQLEILQNKVDLIIDAISNGVPASGSADGGTAYKASMVEILSAAIDADFDSIKSEISFTD